MKKLVQEHGVATIPGSAFGLNKQCVVRISYGALDADSVVEGVGRLRDGILQIVRNHST